MNQSQCLVCCTPIEPHTCELLDPNTGELLQFCSEETGPASPKTSVNELMLTSGGDVRYLKVPVGELAYWQQRIRQLLPNLDVLDIAWNAETPHLPYLGQISCPDNQVAKARLLRWHITQAA